MRLNLAAEHTTDPTKSFFNAYIPVVALLLAFFMAVPHQAPKYLSPDAVNKVTEKHLISRSIPMRRNGKLRPTKRFEEVLGLAKLHKLSATFAVMLRKGGRQNISLLAGQFTDPIHQTIPTVANSRVRIHIMISERLYD